jgi:hypothetical protein
MTTELNHKNESVQAILRILKKANKPITTQEVGKEMQKLKQRCPDSTIVFLNRLRQKKLIQGKRSKEQRGWVWWID